jgi:hypothetical protein
VSDQSGELINLRHDTKNANAFMIPWHHHMPNEGPVSYSSIRFTGANIPAVNAPAGTAIYKGTDSVEACQILQNGGGFAGRQLGFLPVYRDGNIVFEETGSTTFNANTFNNCRPVQ